MFGAIKNAVSDRIDDAKDVVSDQWNDTKEHASEIKDNTITKAKAATNYLSAIASSTHNHLLDESPGYRFFDGVVHDTKHASTELVTEVGDAIENGDPKEVVRSVVSGTGNLAGSTVVRGAQYAADKVDESFAEDHEVVRFEELDPASQNHLKEIFGDSLETENLRFVTGSISEGEINLDIPFVGPTTLDGISPHAIGNTIYMPDDTFTEVNGVYEVNPDRLNLLTHETTHAWQNQNGGGDYISIAVRGMIDSWIETGTYDGKGYDGDKVYNNHESFESMGVEQQATFVEKILSEKLDNGESLTPKEQALLDEIRAGDGAP